MISFGRLFTFVLFTLSVAAAPYKHKRACTPGTPAPAPTSTSAPTSPTPPPSPPPSNGTSCFPNGGAKLADATPGTPRSDWWCPADQLYGFMGFSYPLEDPDCDAESNSFKQINADFKKMKAMGASLVRVYAPECREKSVWENLLKAGIENDMGVIGLVWWGFHTDQTLWKKTRDSLAAVLAENPLAPYVFHSVAFGSEPILDGVDGAHFVPDMRAFKADVLAQYDIPIAISESWELGQLRTADKKLTDLGRQIRNASDMVQAHMMPYYHCEQHPNADNVMDFFTSYIEKTIEPNFPNMPIMVTETQWSSHEEGSHNRAPGGPCRATQNIDNFRTYWNTIQNNCEYWKEHKIGWFVHTFSDEFEDGFGMLNSKGDLKIPFKPPTC